MSSCSGGCSRPEAHPQAWLTNVPPPAGTLPRILAWFRGLLLDPRGAWDAIAAEGDSTRWLWRRYLPVLVLLCLIGGVAGWLLFPPDPSPQTRTTERFRFRPDGGVEHVGTGTSTSVSLRLEDLSAFTAPLFALALLGLVLFSFMAVALQALVARWLILRAAPLYGADPDRAAATKLVIYAQTGAMLAAALSPLPWIGALLSLAGFVHLLVLTYLGAPRLLPPVREEARRFGRAATYRTVFACILVTLFWLAGPLMLGLVLAPLSLLLPGPA